MSVKITKTLTRKEAEDKYILLKQDEMERILRSEAVRMDNESLESVLECMNDKANDGEGFENYIIGN